jgi:glutaryl-CoA dehydrogenase
MLLDDARQAADNYLGLDDEFSSEERGIRDTVRDFVERELRPSIAEHFEKGTFPLEMAPRFGDLGLLGANCDGYGCQSLGAVGYGLACQELERCDSGLRSFASVQSCLVIYPILTFGSEEQKTRWLPDLAAGRKIGCFGLTEPDFGSNPAGMRTVAKQDGGDYLISGRKAWITNGSIADVAVVWAKLGGSDGPIRGFLIERGTPGFSATNIERKFSLRASVTSELALDNVRVPASAMLPGSEELNLKAALMCLNQARYGIAWGVVGAASDCLAEALAYATERVQFDRPIAGYQLVQKKLVEMLAEITTAQLLCLRLARLKDAGTLKHHHVSLAKMNNVRVARDAARTAREILGASGITYEYRCGRHLCNMETVYTYEGTHDIHTLIVGQKLTGISAIS